LNIEYNLKSAVKNKKNGKSIAAECITRKRACAIMVGC